MSLIKGRMFLGNNGIHVLSNVDGQSNANIYGVTFGTGTFQSITKLKETDRTSRIKQNWKETLNSKRDNSANSFNLDVNDIQSKLCKTKDKDSNVQEESGKPQEERVKLDEDDGTNKERHEKLHDARDNCDPGELLCSLCNENRKITNYCLTCDFLTCFQCEKGHQIIDHEFVKQERKPGKGSYDTCAKHKKYDLDLFCLQCETYICVACKALTHINHNCFDLKYDNYFVKPEKDVDEDIDKAVLDNVKTEQIVTIATGIEWRICSPKKKATRICLSFPCRLL